MDPGEADLEDSHENHQTFKRIRNCDVEFSGESGEPVRNPQQTSLTTLNEGPSKRLRRNNADFNQFDILPNARVKETREPWLHRFLHFDLEDCKGPVEITSATDRGESENVQGLYEMWDEFLLNHTCGLKRDARLFVQWTLLPDQSDDDAAAASDSTEVLWGATLLGPAPGDLRDKRGRRVFLIEYDEGSESDEAATTMQVVFLSRYLLLHPDQEGYACSWELSDEKPPDQLSALHALIETARNLKANGTEAASSALASPHGEELLANLWVSLVAKPAVLQETTRRVCDILSNIGLDAAQQRSMAGAIGNFVSRVRSALVSVAQRVNSEGRQSISEEDIRSALNEAGFNSGSARFPSLGKYE